MKRYLIVTCLFLSMILLLTNIINAQKLTNGGRPKILKVQGLLEAHCINLPNTIRICKGKKRQDRTGAARLVAVIQMIGIRRVKVDGQTGKIQKFKCAYY